MLLRLPVFIFLLIFKNILSWTKMLWMLAGFPVLIVGLLILNITAGAIVYLAYLQATQTQHQLDQAKQKLARQQHFWKSLYTQFPTHRVIHDTYRLLFE